MDRHGDTEMEEFKRFLAAMNPSERQRPFIIGENFLKVGRLEANLEELRRRLALLPYTESSHFEGCSDEEIAKLEKYAGDSLPLCYRQFLKLMGRGAGHLFRGGDGVFSDAHRLRFRGTAKRLLRKRKVAWSLPHAAFVFFVNIGPVFSFFLLNDGDDPPIYVVTGLDPYPRLLHGHFMWMLEDNLMAWEQFAARKPSYFKPRPK